MKILFFFSHPAQYLFLRETIRRLAEADRHQLVILIKTKDVLETLIRHDGLDYVNILPRYRGNSTFAVLSSLFKRLVTIIPVVLRHKPDLLIGTDATIALVGKVFGIHRITIVEDDYEVIRKLATLTYPFTETILCPEVCRVGPWVDKKIGYQGYMKLAYLSPSIFVPNQQIRATHPLGNRFVLIRLSQLKAHHDTGIRGIPAELVMKMIDLLESKDIDIRISSEGELDNRFLPYALTIDPSHIHHILAQATLLVSDSQSMSVEAAMLGIPSIRYSDFVGKISVLEELEHTYHLTVGIRPGHETLVLDKIVEWLEQPDVNSVFLARRQTMLNDKIDVTAFLVWFLDEYPASRIAMKANPNYQNRFKLLGALNS
ncbi:hypothetical protein [Spirosoma rigui]|uniref:hypothetical protein n=1 Tax=Spirosoma rigui TaxID=564064 RepID=UPI0009AFD1FB|nr:hypothetical protein [Spirosoma rigui]